MSSSNNLNHSLDLLRQTGTSGAEQSDRLSLMLDLSANIDVFQPTNRVSLQSFLEAYPTFQNTVQAEVVPSHFLEHFASAISWFRLNTVYPEVSHRVLTEDEFLIDALFMILSLLPTDDLLLRGFVLGSEISTRFSPSMQAILNLQMAQAHASTGNRDLASQFANTAIQTCSCISSFPGVSSMQTGPVINSVKSEADPSPHDQSSTINPTSSSRSHAPHLSSNLAAAFLGLTPEPDSPPSRMSRTSRSSRRSTAVQLIDDEEAQDIKPNVPDVEPVLIDQAADEAQSGDNVFAHAAESDDEFDELKPSPKKTPVNEPEEKPSLPYSNSSSEDNSPIIPEKRRIQTLHLSPDDGPEISKKTKPTNPLASASSRSTSNASTCDQAKPDYSRYPAGPKAGFASKETFLSKYMRSLADLDHHRHSDKNHPVIDSSCIISSSQPWGSTANEIKLSKIQSPGDIRTHKQDLLDHLRYESKGITIDTDRLFNIYWNYQINGQTPFAPPVQPWVLDENKRLFRHYLDYYEKHSIKALPATKLKICLFFVDEYSNKALSTTQNYVNSLINACMVAKIMFPNEIAGSFPLVPELNDDKIWMGFLKEQEEYDKNKKPRQKPEVKAQKGKRRARES